DAIYIRSGECFAYVNQAAIRLFGVTSREELLGKPVLDFYHPDDHARIIERRTILQTGQAVPVTEHCVVQRDGTLVHVEVVAIPCTYEGRPAAQIVVHDIDPRKRAEAA